MTVHPAALVLADHVFYGNPDRSHPGRCACFDWAAPGAGWRGPAADHPAHQADALMAAGMLRTDWTHGDAGGTPPETPTERVLKARAEAEARGLPFGDGWTCDLPAGHGGTGGGGWAHAKAPETPETPTNPARKLGL